MFCFMPVLKGMWKQHELWDGTYILSDLLDIHEAVDVQQKNEGLLYEHMKKKSEADKIR